MLQRLVDIVLHVQLVLFQSIYSFRKNVVKDVRFQQLRLIFASLSLSSIS